MVPTDAGLSGASDEDEDDDDDDDDGELVASMGASRHTRVTLAAHYSR